MPGRNSDALHRRVEPFDSETFESRLKETLSASPVNRWIGEYELRHLIRVVTECSLLLTDVYSDERIERIMHPERGELARLVRRLIDEGRRGEGEVLYHVRRLPDDVRVVGDKALFDLGIFGLNSVKGHDLGELGARAYRLAGEVLELLARDPSLREFFNQNRILMFPLEEEIEFLRQCSENFKIYTELLRKASRPHCTATVEALSIPDGAGLVLGPWVADDEYLDAARGDAGTGDLLDRDQLLSAYERMILFASVDMERLHGALSTVVVDQDEAVRTLCDEFSLYAAGTRDLRKPPAFFLVGPTGVGKNHLVESLCRLLEGVWNSEIPLLTIEGPNYTYSSDINELRGATRGFIRSDEEGLLSTFHERSSRAPFSIILVDEVEKAHAQLRTFFLSMLDRGTVTDNKGKVLNFSNSMVFFTSNLGYSDLQQKTSAIGYTDGAAREAGEQSEIAQKLRRVLKPEFINRLRIIHFGRLGRDSAERILDLELDRIVRRYRDMHALELLLTPSAREELIERGFSARYGARHMAATLESVCNVAIARKIRNDDRKGTKDRGELVSWLRGLRGGKTPLDIEQIKRRVVETARADLDYNALSIDFADGRFCYVPFECGRGDR